MDAGDGVPPIRHDEYLLRQFVASRDGGDPALARRWWDDLVGANYDRLHGMVRVTSRGHLSPAEQQDALQEILTKLLVKAIDDFRGVSMGEWVNYCKQVVFGVCVDEQRRAQRHSRRRASLDAHSDDGHGTDGVTTQVFEALEDRSRQEAEAVEEAENDAERRVALDRGIERLTPRRRAVIELLREGLSTPEIQERLGVSSDVVHQSCSRGLRDLRRFWLEEVS